MAIDIGRSIRICRVQQDMDNQEISRRLGMHVKQVSKTANTPSANAATIERFAKLFGMKPSAFIALGETAETE